MSAETQGSLEWHEALNLRLQLLHSQVITLTSPFQSTSDSVCASWRERSLSL